MAFQLQSSYKLWDRGIDDESVKNIHVIADEDAGALRIEVGSALHFKTHTRNTQDVAKKPSLRPVIPAWVEENSEDHQKGTNGEKVQSTDDPNEDAAGDEIKMLHIRNVIRDV